MKLSDYLEAEGLTRAQFAERVPAHPVTVSKWCSLALRPSWPNMERIKTITGGKVTAGDFMAEAPA